MSEPDRLLEELQAIKFLLTLSNSEVVDTYMNKVISTTTRRKMWTLIDGRRFGNDIAKEVGTSPAAVSYFLTSVQTAGLVKYDSKSPPRRVIDYTPSEWFKEIEEAEAKKKPTEGANQEVKPKETESQY
ncbi:MAG: hypothetical protein ABIJ47_12665 [Candidatus Bathyarchaeota archaeon]